MSFLTNWRRKVSRWIAPKTGMIHAKYDAARRAGPDQDYWKNADGLSARAANSPEVRRVLRERSRYEADNNGFVGGTLATRTHDLVGCGPRLSVSVPFEEDGDPNTLSPQELAAQQVEKAWNDWADSVNLWDKLLVTEESKERDGEAFLVATRNSRTDNPVELDVTVVETDQCATPYLRMGEVDGVELDANGNPLAYHFLRQHPGDTGLMMLPGGAYTRVPASDVIHWFRPRRAQQARGVPDTVAALPLASELRRYTTATRQTAETQAKLAVVLKTDQPAPDEDDDEFSPSPFETKEVEFNSLMALPHQWEASTLQPSAVAQNIDSFSKTTLREMGRGLCTPLNTISGDSSGYNFSSARLDSLVYRGERTIERSRFKRLVLNRIYRWWFKEASLAGVIPQLPAGWTHDWYFDAFPFIDPQAEAQAEGEELTNGTTTLQDVCGKRGKDWREVIRQRAREKKMLDQFGLTIVAKPAAPAAPAPNQDPQYQQDAAASLALAASYGTRA